MKKTYPFKPLAVLISTFDVMMFIGSLCLCTISIDTFLGSQLVFGLLILMSGVLGSLCAACLTYYYNAQKEKCIGILACAIANTVIPLLFIYLVFYSSSLGGMFKFVTFLTLLLAVACIFALLRLDDKIQTNILDAYLPHGKTKSKATLQEDVSSGSNATSESNKTVSLVITKDSIKKFISSKNGKIVIASIVVLLILFGGYKIWDTFFNRTVIDPFEDMTLEFSGYDGSGNAYIEDYPDIDYDITNDKMAAFIHDIDYEIENDGKLSNGDKVVVKATYSKETAKSAKVDLETESKEFEVEGLTVLYKSADEIDEDLYEEAFEFMMEEVSDEVDASAFYKSYYLCQPDLEPYFQDNYLIFVFTRPYQTYNYQAKKDVIKTRYISYYVEFDSSFDSDKSFAFSKSLHKPDSWEYIYDEKDVDEAVKYAYTAYSRANIEEINFAD